MACRRRAMRRWRPSRIGARRLGAMSTLWNAASQNSAPSSSLQLRRFSSATRRARRLRPTVRPRRSSTRPSPICAAPAASSRRRPWRAPRRLARSARTRRCARATRARPRTSGPARWTFPALARLRPTVARRLSSRRRCAWRRPYRAHTRRRPRTRPGRISTEWATSTSPTRPPAVTPSGPRRKHAPGPPATTRASGIGMWPGPQGRRMS
mmetsp:Transcript_89658/g.258654  ORF Transcript_89658/g.258654 Transcript_89658/m.258654 type:complete len:210 (-) Transcript_89658:1166-1795(-)